MERVPRRAQLRHPLAHATLTKSICGIRFCSVAQQTQSASFDKLSNDRGPIRQPEPLSKAYRHRPSFDPVGSDVHEMATLTAQYQSLDWYGCAYSGLVMREKHHPRAQESAASFSQARNQPEYQAFLPRAVTVLLTPPRHLQFEGRQARQKSMSWAKSRRRSPAAPGLQDLQGAKSRPEALESSRWPHPRLVDGRLPLGVDVQRNRVIIFGERRVRERHVR